jgi:flagellar protein FliO/FliZ
MKVQRFLLPVALTAVLVVACLCAAAPAAARVSKHAAPKHAAYHQPKGLFAAEQTPVSFGSATSTQKHASTGGGTSILRTILGLVVVIALIYGIAWVLRRVRRSREGRVVGNGLASVATLPLGGGRSLHLVRAANDLILVGASEHGVTPIRTYTEEEARAHDAALAGSTQHDAALAGTVSEWQPAADWQQPEDQWRTLREEPTALAAALEQLRRLTVRS